MGMFDNYQNLENQKAPDNRHKFVEIDETDTIIRGGTCYHIFELPFKWSENVVTEDPATVGVRFYNSVAYLSGAYKILEKFQAKNEFTIIESEDCDKTFVKIKLTPEETISFKKGRQTEAQLRLKLKPTAQQASGDIIFSKRMLITVIDTVHAGEDDPNEPIVEANIDELVKLL